MQYARDNSNNIGLMRKCFADYHVVMRSVSTKYLCCWPVKPICTNHVDPIISYDKM